MGMEAEGTEADLEGSSTQLAGGGRGGRGGEGAEAERAEGYVAMMGEPREGEALWEAFPLTVKRFNPVFFWSWDVHSDHCAICRVMLMEPCLNCQVNNKTSCVVVWGECNHAFHNCCMAAWMKNASHAGAGAGQASKCPLCQAEWLIQRIGN